MDKDTVGTVISVAKQWWLKVNTKPVRIHDQAKAFRKNITHQKPNTVSA